MQYTTSLDPVTVRHKKCSGACGEYKAPDQFYSSKAGRASPYCIECNARAVNVARLRRELREHGTEAFVARIAQKDAQLQDMIRVLKDYKAT